MEVGEDCYGWRMGGGKCWEWEKGVGSALAVGISGLVVINSVCQVINVRKCDVRELGRGDTAGRRRACSNY